MEDTEHPHLVIIRMHVPLDPQKQPMGHIHHK